MAIPAETRSSEHLLGYGSYHVAALKADRESAHLTASVEQLIGALRTAFAAREAAEQAELEAFARYNRADFELDEACRICELEVLAAVGKDRADRGARSPPRRVLVFHSKQQRVDSNYFHYSARLWLKDLGMHGTPTSGAYDFDDLRRVLGLAPVRGPLG
jgi:hypothetical protein